MAAKRSYPTSAVRGSSRECQAAMAQEQLRGATNVQGQGRQLRVPGCNSAGAAKRSYPTPEARGFGRKEQPHIQGAVAVQVQEGLEELFHVQGQEGRW